MANLKLIGLNSKKEKIRLKSCYRRQGKAGEREKARYNKKGKKLATYRELKMEVFRWLEEFFAKYGGFSSKTRSILGKGYKQIYGWGYNLCMSMRVWAYNYRRFKKYNARVIGEFNKGVWLRYRYNSFLQYNLALFTVTVITQPTLIAIRRFYKYALHRIETIKL